MAATVYFLVSNFVVWIGGGLALNNLPYAKTWTGITECYTAAIPFYLNSIYATLTFSVILFGAYYLVNKYALKNTLA